jgi:hypothetical protein
MSDKIFTISKMSKWHKQYKDLPSEIKEQIAYLDKKFPTHPQIDRNARFLAKEGGLEDPKIARALSILDFFDTYEFLSKRFFEGIYAFDGEGRRVELVEKLTKKKKIDHVCLFNGVCHNPVDKAKSFPVVVKWYQSSRRDTDYEISMYCELRAIGCKIPWFSSSYLLWKTPVLIMEPLKPVTGDDDEFEVAAQVIQQFKKIHKKGIHNDIKPQNVMKRLYKNDSDKGADRGKWEYIVIDYGGMTTEKLEKGDKKGWKRSVWSPKYTCQKPHPEDPQITTQWHDFKETGYMMKEIQNMRKGKKSKSKTTEGKKKDIIRDGPFEGKLEIFMDYLKSIDKYKVKPEHYDNLISICRTGKTLNDLDVPKKKIISPPPGKLPKHTIYAP